MLIFTDLENASFAGQHDTLLGIVGVENVVVAVKKYYPPKSGAAY